VILTRVVTYESLLKQECSDKNRISKDVTRTFPDHEFFQENVIGIKID